ncbi:hypothetical protein M1446_03715 [Candidatus Dependentiae bacterium]|nr:hypothetical protein [Candidatus Dependentiae bacterium]
MNICKSLFFLGIIFFQTNQMQALFKKEDKQSEADFKASEELLNYIKKDFEKLRGIIADALEKNVLDMNQLNAAIKRLSDYNKRIDILERLNKNQKSKLKSLAKIIDMTYNALKEEAYVLQLWMQGYQKYETDLNDNFKSNQFVKKPDFKKLYEELGFKPGEGSKASFNAVRQKYKELYNKIKSQADKSRQDFNDYFIPYLRPIEYVFRTPYSKLQYEAYLQGQAVYNNKANQYKKFETAINKFNESLEIHMLSVMIDQALQ